MKNGKAYIGLTTKKDPKHRWSQHKYCAKNGSERCPYLYSAIRKYGADNFNFELIGKAKSKKELNIAEQAFISMFGTHYSDGGYNIAKGGLAHKNDPKTRKKLSESYYKGQYHKERKPVDKYDLEGNLIESFESISKVYKDLPITGGCVSKCCRGEAYTAHGFVWRFKGEPFDKYPIKGNDTKPVDKYDLSGKLIKTYSSITEASNETGSTIANIVSCCKGDIKTSLGYVFRYKDEPFDKYNIKHESKSPVLQVDPETDKVLKKFKSVLAAARHFGKGHDRNTHIYDVRDTDKTAYGYKWRCANECV